MSPRRGLALAGLAASGLAWLVVLLPFWLPRVVPLRGSNAVAAAWLLGTLAFAVAGIALSLAALLAPARRAGPRDAASMLLALAAAAPALFVVLAFALLGAADLHV